MRIAVSGTHYMGKSTLIDDFIKQHPEYSKEVEAYYAIQDNIDMESALEPTFESLIEQLDYNIEKIEQYSAEDNIIFDRCPIDYIAYAMCIAEQDAVNIQDTEVADKFTEIKRALNNLDFIFFLPITKKHLIEYTEENPAYRTKADFFFKSIYRDDMLDIFPSYNHPKIIEIYGFPSERIKKINSCLI